MIKIEGVSKIYDGRIKAVDNLNMNIHQGEIFGFLGPNGAGKTTTLRMITGILAPTTGDILINGIDIKKIRFRLKGTSPTCLIILIFLIRLQE